MRLPYTRVQLKHLSYLLNQTNYNFDNNFTGSLPDLIVVGLLDDADFAGGYQQNLFNFQNFSVNPIELRRNGTPVLRSSYTPNFAYCQYIKDYEAMQKQLEFGKSYKCVNLTLTYWANGYRFNAFKITGRPICSNTESPPSRPTTGLIRLEVCFAPRKTTTLK